MTSMERIKKMAEAKFNGPNGRLVKVNYDVNKLMEVTVATDDRTSTLHIREWIEKEAEEFGWTSVGRYYMGTKQSVVVEVFQK